VILGLQAPIPGIRRKHDEYADKVAMIASGIAHAKEAHKPDQTDRPSPGTDHLTSRPTRQCTRESRWQMAPSGGAADPTCQPFRLSFGGKLDPILLKAVDDVSMFRDGGNRSLKL